MPEPSSRTQLLYAIAVIVLSVAVTFLVRDVVGPLVLGAIIAFLINPAADALEDRGVPRVAAIAVLFLLLLTGAGLVLSAIVPVLTTETTQLAQQAPSIFAQAQDQIVRLQGRPVLVFGVPLDLFAAAQSMQNRFNELLLGQFANAINIGLAAVNFLLQALLMLIVAFLLTLHGPHFTSGVRALVPQQYRPDFDVLWPRLRHMLLGYLRGQLTMAAIIGVGVGVAFAIENVRFAFALGLLAGITALVPFVGPFIGAVPAVLVALSDSPTKAIIAAITYFVVANIVLQLLYPRIVGHAVDLPALAVIVAFIAGFSLAGIVGVFVAIPIAAAGWIVLRHVHPRVYGS